MGLYLGLCWGWASYDGPKPLRLKRLQQFCGDDGESRTLRREVCKALNINDLRCATFEAERGGFCQAPTHKCLPIRLLWYKRCAVCDLEILTSAHD